MSALAKQTHDAPPSESPAPTLNDGDGQLKPHYSPARKYTLLVLFCAAQFLDAFNNCALFPAIPVIVKELNVTESESAWIISAFQLTFASFLLISGRISDIYNPKYAFVIGAAILGIISLGIGFVNDKISMIVLRAVSGIAASLTIPSALTLLVNLFPEPAEQARALGCFGGCGAMGNVLGLIIGALLIEFLTWRWVFWFVAIIVIPIAITCMFLIPEQAKKVEDPSMLKTAKWKSLDLIGVTDLTIAIILFIFAVTSASTTGWASARVLAPLIISIFMVVLFFVWETRVPSTVAAVPPQTWFLPNFAVLVSVALLPSFWWVTIFNVFITLWEEIFEWSVINTAVRMIPIGVFAFAMSFSGGLSRLTSPKWVLLFAQSLVIIATLLLHWGGSPSHYWPFVFPAFVLGACGSMLCYTHAYIAIFRTTPSSMAGTVGAIFNSALQLGSAVGLAIDTSIETSIEQKHGGPSSYTGRAAVLWFVLAFVCVEAISLLVFYRVEAEKKPESEEGADFGVVDEKFRKDAEVGVPQRTGAGT